MTFVSGFVIGVFGMCVLLGIEGLVGERIVSLLALAAMVLTVLSVASTGDASQWATMETAGLIVGGIVGLAPGYGFKQTIQIDGQPLVWALLGI